MDINFVGDMQRLDIKPGDRYVITSDVALSAEMVGRIRDVWKSFAGDTPLLVLDAGLKLGAISATDQAVTRKTLARDIDSLKRMGR